MGSLSIEQENIIRAQVTQDYIAEKNLALKNAASVIVPKPRVTTITNEQITQHIKEISSVQKSSKIAVFLDTSASIKRNKLDAMYELIVGKIKNA
jgi:hypothetical protein